MARWTREVLWDMIGLGYERISAERPKILSGAVVARAKRTKRSKG
jgi:hypothetical protein